MKAKITLMALLIASIGVIACGETNPSKSGEAVYNQEKVTVSDVNAAQLKELMASQPGIILDVRTPEEVAEGVIPGAIHINIYDDDFKERIAQLDASKPIYAYCKMGGRSAKAAKQLVAAGFQQVYNLKGGYTGWTKAGYETSKL